MSYKYNEILKMINNGMEPFLMYQISKEEVLSGDMKQIGDFMKLINRLGSHARQRCAIMCSGYDDVPDELFEIKEVRKYVHKLFKKFPYLLYYINTEIEAQHWLMSSLADEVEYVLQGDYSVKQMNAFELYEKFGTNTPTFQALLTFKDNRLTGILQPIIDHGKKIGDKEGATKIAWDYAHQFDTTDQTLREMGFKNE